MVAGAARVAPGFLATAFPLVVVGFLALDFAAAFVVAGFALVFPDLVAPAPALALGLVTPAPVRAPVVRAG